MFSEDSYEEPFDMPTSWVWHYLPIKAFSLKRKETFQSSELITVVSLFS